MTWNELMGRIMFEIIRNPSVANMPATIWLYDDVMYRSGEHEICSLDAYFPEDEVSEGNRLSMNLFGRRWHVAAVRGFVWNSS